MMRRETREMGLVNYQNKDTKTRADVETVIQKQGK